MMFAKRILAIFVSTACAATFLVGCSDDSWAAKTDDTTVPAGQYIYYILKETMDAEQKLDATPSTSDSDFFKLTIEDQSAESWIQSHARKDMKNAVGAEIEFENLGLSLTDEETKEIADQVDNYYDYLDEYYHISDLGISKNSLEKAMTDNKKYDKVFDSYYQAGGSQEVPAEDISNYIRNEGASYKMMTVPKEVSPQISTDSMNTPATVTATDSSTAEAQGYVDQINSGKSFDDVYHDYEISTGTTEEDFVPLELQYAFKDEPLDLSDEVYSAIFDKAQVDGPAVLAEGDDSFYIIQRYSVSDETVSQEHDAALTEMKEDEFSGELSQIADTKKYQENNGALDRYSPRAIQKRLDKFRDSSLGY